jgi:K(+)-stimulated pyrophosphate-energized sodium pump
VTIEKTNVNGAVVGTVTTTVNGQVDTKVLKVLTLKFNKIDALK